MTTGHKSLKGQLLLDNGKLYGSFFQRTVVLVCQHDEQGAFGLVLNRMMDAKVGDEANVPAILKDETLYAGGPVQPKMLSYLHTSPHMFDGNVMHNLDLGVSLNSLIEVSESFSPGGEIRVFAGYAGWSAGQLDEEVARESWMTHPATVELIFQAKPKDLWQTILMEKGDLKYRMLAVSPEDLSWN